MFKFGKKKFTDPVCGMSVTEKTQWTAEYKGTKYYFCSENCLREFQNNPEKYVHSMSHEHVHDHSHGCC